MKRAALILAVVACAWNIAYNAVLNASGRQKGVR